MTIPSRSLDGPKPECERPTNGRADLHSTTTEVTSSCQAPVPHALPTLSEDYLGEEPMADSQSFYNSFANQEEADAEQRRWRNDAPPVTSAYIASGRTTSAAVALALLLAIPLSCLIVLTVIIVVNTILNFAVVISGHVWGVIILKGAFSEAAQHTYELMAKSVLALASLLPMPFVLSGLVQYTTSRITRLGNNRSRRLDLAAGTAAIVVAFVCLVFAASGVLGPLPRQTVTGASLTLTLIYYGLLCAVTVPVMFTWDKTGISSEHKWCEPCRNRMAAKKLPQLSFRAARYALAALETNDMCEFINRLKGEAGNRATPVIYACPTCHSGFVELEVHFNGQWKNNNGLLKFTIENWLAASVAAPAKVMGIAFDRFSVKWSGRVLR